TLDDEYVERACPDRADWYTATDSDEICVLEFSDRDHKRGMLAHAPVLSDPDVIRFVAESTTPTHRLHVRRHIRFHTRDVVPAEWGEVTVRSDRLVKRYLHLFETRLAGQALTGPFQEEVERWLNPGAGTPLGGDSAAVRAVRWLARPAYRFLHYPLYRYAGRLNAELIHLRTLLHLTRVQLAAATKRLELVEQTQADEDAAGYSPRGTGHLSNGMAKKVG
ncbi:MAG: hypothetical protein JWO38_3658, partial [Gemmataceae bacterium]|nr:hypothetical protein [Gemmataceae bacterium]